MVIKRDFTWTEIGILIGIKNCDNLKDITVNKMVGQIKINRSHPLFYNVLSYLLQNNLVTIDKVVGNVRLFEIDGKGIRDLLDEQILINKLINDYLKRDHHFIW